MSLWSEREIEEALNLEAMRLNALVVSFMIHQIFNIHFCLSAFRSDVSGEITKTSKSEQIFVMFFSSSVQSEAECTPMLKLPLNY